MLTRRTFLTHTATASALLSPLRSLAFEEQNILGPSSLRAHAERRGLLTGTAVDVRILNTNPTYRQILVDQYDILVAEREMKWHPLRPAPDKFDFTDADTLVAFAQEHKIQLRGHNFVWHQSLPDWFETTVTKDNARQVLTDHILTVGRRYAGKIQSWDVVNEAILPSDKLPGGLRNSPWLKLLGPEYLEIAFRTARQADPHARLTYNDYGIENDSQDDTERRASVLQLLRGLQAAKVPLDAVGIQSHISAGSKHTIGKPLMDFLAEIRKMGLEIYITEFDVNDDDVEGSTEERDQAITAAYRQYLELVLQEPAVKSVLTWGVDDNHTWLNSIPSHKKKQPDRAARPLPFDTNYRAKPAFFAMRDAFDHAPTRKGTKLAH
jgi:endo-1,4-beta-xylanase